MDFKPQKSVEWYDPAQLAGTGVKAVISSIFGNFNDKREIQAALDYSTAIKSFNYSDQEEIWIDYIADLGDGFDATYTMAKLLAEDTLTLNKHTLNRGNILIMGGDQVYPVATREEYRNRLQGPYNAALPPDNNDEDGKNAPDLFAVPGNHDWYDGLSAFIKVFCQQRWIGNWRTKQKRSYFALKLPHNVWLFGIDVQLNSDVDYNQIQYFKEIINNEVADGSKLILCTAEPTWVYSTSGKSDSNKNLEFFEKQIIGEGKTDAEPKLKQVITIAGDFHHYARYENENGGLKFTAGGGGAFMHPTQNLPKKIDKISGGTLHLQKTFPEAKASKNLIFHNYKFPVTNFKMGIVLGAIYALAGWMLYLNKPVDHPGVLEILTIPLYKPSILLLLVLILAGLGAFADTKPYNPRFKSSLLYAWGGIKHGLLHIILILGSFFFINNNNPVCDCYPIYHMLFLIMVCAVSGFVLGGFMFGLYLIIANVFLGNHDNEAYSSLKWEGYKNFLRLHITKDAVTVYPIGVKEVANWKSTGSQTQAFTTNNPAKANLIETPITIPL